MPEILNKSVKVVRNRVLFSSFLELHAVTIEQAGRQENSRVQYEREALCFGISCAVLLYDPWKDAILLVEQVRAGAIMAGAEPWCIELPAGRVEGNNTPYSAAAAEVREETGYEIDKLYEISKLQPSPGSSDELVYTYLAITGLDNHGVFGLENEHIITHIVKRATALEMANNGDITSSVAYGAILWLELNHRHIQHDFLSKTQHQPLAGETE